MGDIWIARHAPVAVQGTCYGQSDVPTVMAAEAAAQIVATRWSDARHAPCAELWTSPWERTRLVAAALGEAWGIPYHVDPRLSELSFGEWEGRSFAEIERDDATRFSRWMSAYQTEAPPGGETVASLMARAQAWLDERKREPRSVLAVTHAGVVRAIRALESGRGYADLVSSKVDHLVPERVRGG